MQRKQALVVAASVAILGATGVVATAAVSGINILGFHVASPFKQASAEGATTSSDPTDPPTTPAPVYVVTTELYDQLIVVPTPKQAAAQPAAAAADPYAPYAPDNATYADPTDPAPAAAAPAAPAAATTSATSPAAPTAPTNAPTPAPTPAPTAAPATTATTAAATTTTTRVTTTGTTVFNPAGPVPAGFSVPANLKVAASQTPLPPGGPFTKCQFEDNHTWNCEK